jgi:membrane-bound inhibitor of C-type lysozyme
MRPLFLALAPLALAPLALAACDSVEDGTVNGTTAENAGAGATMAGSGSATGGDSMIPATAPPETTSASYRCDDNSRFDAAFDNRSNVVTIRGVGDRQLVLNGQPAASGIWYQGSGYELRGKGQEATFTAPGAAPVACRAN